MGFANKMRDSHSGQNLVITFILRFYGVFKSENFFIRDLELFTLG